MYTFFFSYARDDQDGGPLIVEIFDELRRAVRRELGARETEPIGFLDQKAIEIGQPWPQELAAALQESLVLVALYSPSYFQREYCGKEFQVFLDRQAAHAKQHRTDPPRAILPLVWYPSDRFMPQPIRGLQYHEGQFGAAYKENGLWQLAKLRLGKYRDDFEEFLPRFAKRIVQAAEQKLAPLDAPPVITLTCNAFEAEPAPPQTAGEATQAPSAGPASVGFVYVAATKAELKGARIAADLARYGEAHGWEWVPYPPPESANRLGLVATRIASEKGFFPEPMALDGQLMARLETAKASNSLVVLLVDARTLKIDIYRKQMAAYDDWNFLNCAAVVVWDGEPASARERDELEGIVARVFDDNYATRFPRFFRPAVRSGDDLRRELADALETLHLTMVSKGTPQRSAGPSTSVPSL